MKKFTLILTVFCLISGLFGCAAMENIPPVPTARVEAENTNAPAAEAKTETRHQHIIISYDRAEYNAYDPQQGTELILSFSYVSPYIHIPASPGAESLINEFIAMLNESFYTGDDYGLAYNSGCAPGYNNMLTMAEDHYNYIINSSENFETGAVTLELSNRRDMSVLRCDESVLSMCSYDFLNIGDGRESVAYNVYNFDIQSGELLTLDAVSCEGADLSAFVTSCIREREGAELDFAFSEADWYLDDMGLRVLMYSMEAAGSDGAEAWWEYTVPYSELSGYLKPEYFPDEISETASFHIAPAKSNNDSGVEIIDMLKLEEDGQALYLIAEGSAKNVSINRVDYTEGFYLTERLWHCSEMKDCALQLLVRTPEGMPEIEISYTDAAGEHELYLSQNGEDGGFTLVDGSVEAVG